MPFCIEFIPISLIIYCNRSNSTFFQIQAYLSKPFQSTTQLSKLYKLLGRPSICDLIDRSFSVGFFYRRSYLLIQSYTQQIDLVPQQVVTFVWLKLFSNLFIFVVQVLFLLLALGEAEFDEALVVKH